MNPTAKSQIPNRTLFTGDNLPIMRGMNGGSVDLVYLDPPFNSNKDFSAPVGSEAAGASFKDAWTLSDEDEAWHAELKSHHPKLYAIIHAAGAVGGRGDKSYLIYMAVRMLEIHRILKDTGSVYLHVDPVMSHSLKLVMDAIFGRTGFRNEIIWHYYNIANVARKHFGRKHDVILAYAGRNSIFNWDDMREPYSENSNWAKNPESYGDKRYKADPRGKLMHDVWRIPAINNMAKERTGYPTQKPLALLDRIVRASSGEGDVVFDPFCGCATACVAAEILHRNWIGIDISPKALELVKRRLDKEVLGEGKVFKGKVLHRTDIPQRTDIPRKKMPRAQSKKLLYGNQAGICNGCGIHFPIQNLTHDHIVPDKQGGPDIIENLQLLCGNCNSIKGDRTMEYLKARLKEIK